MDTCVVCRRRISVVNPPAFLRILMMSVGDDDGDGAGDAAGDRAKVVVEENKTSIRTSETEKNGCFILFMAMFCFC